jgi:hypothetical protein
MGTPSASLLWPWNRGIDRLPYLLTGVVLFAVKWGIDWTVATHGFGQPWSPLNYLIWPNDRVLRVFELGDPQRAFSLTMLAVSLPFIWAGVILTSHRLRAAGLPQAFVAFFFVPLVNLLLFLVLVLVPTQPTPVLEPAEPPRRRLEPWRQAHRRLARDSHWRSGLVALAVTVPLAVLAVWLGAQVLQSYGFSLFVGAPFALGMFSVLLFGFSRPQPFGLCMVVAMAAATLAGVVIIAVAFEGLICLLMAAPIAYGLAFLGALVGYAIQARPWLNDQLVSVALAVLVALPALMAAESATQPEPDVRAVDTEVIIDAPPAEVWPHVLAFPPLREPDDWLFQTGVAYPQRAEIRGTGVGAVRHCVFSTGTFSEPIEAWEPPTLLRFGVRDQPEPMREWSPYAIHPPHLHGYLESRRGQFLLEALPDGRTWLVGTTWYSNRMWPAAYWNLWSDYVIHRIHGRVLTHIKGLAESGRP